MIARYGPEKIAELMRTLRTTLDIDDALERVYGFDQHGLDTEWRLQIGLDPLPRPDDLEQRNPTGPTQESPSQESAVTTPAPGPETPDQRPEPGAPASAQGPPLRTGTSCSSPDPDAQTTVPLGMIALGLLAGPLLFRRRKRADDSGDRANGPSDSGHRSTHLPEG